MDNTYFVSACTYRKRAILQSERLSSLLIEVLQTYRRRRDYLLHEYVVMPDHLHLLISLSGSTLERCMSLIKGGFSYRARKGGLFTDEIWQQRYYDRRVRDQEEYWRLRQYLLMNPVRRGLCISPEQFQASSAKIFLDPVPQRLKPLGWEVAATRP